MRCHTSSLGLAWPATQHTATKLAWPGHTPAAAPDDKSCTPSCDLPPATLPRVPMRCLHLPPAAFGADQQRMPTATPNPTAPRAPLPSPPASCGDLLQYQHPSGRRSRRGCLSMLGRRPQAAAAARCKLEAGAAGAGSRQGQGQRSALLLLEAHVLEQLLRGGGRGRRAGVTEGATQGSGHQGGEAGSRRRPAHQGVWQQQLAPATAGSRSGMMRMASHPGGSTPLTPLLLDSQRLSPMECTICSDRAEPGVLVCHM